MQKIDGHIIDADLLTPNGWILDAGCRGFSLKKELGDNYRYICLDPDPLIIPPHDVIFENKALMSYDGKTGYCGWSTGEGNYCYKSEAVHYAETDIEVECTTIASLMRKYNIPIFDLAKIDIEGSEYDLLYFGVEHAFAKQVSVEFHDGCGHNHHGTHEDYISKLRKSHFGSLYKIVDYYEYPDMKGMYEYLFKLR